MDHHKHSNLFTNQFIRPEVVKDFLRHYLTPYLLKEVGLDTLPTILRQEAQQHRGIYLAALRAPHTDL